MVDLGCGNGVLGLMALEYNPEAELLFLDESYGSGIPKSVKRRTEPPTRSGAPVVFRSVTR